MGKRIPLFEYLAWLFKQSQQLQESQARKDYFRIVDVKKKNSGYVLAIQIIGKACTFSGTPEEILAKDDMIELFSSKDIRAITYYACIKNSPRNEILTQKIDKENNLIFCLRNNENHSVIQKTAKEISLDENLIDSLSSKDAHRVGYAVAQELEKYTNQ